ncbi:MAG: tetratricopeptide repeat protein [Candidatus Scalindua rubra]|nr:tetratricopeptide repeat protein [Candidatus Scalindua rubra]TWU35436.1 tetratricopeptide repeat protein [Candidatus Brocadiaceae bacterium S225]
MPKTKIIVLLLFVFAFALLCKTTFAESPKNSENNFLLHNSTESYVDFCTGFYLMLDHRWEDAIVFLEKTLRTNPNVERIHNYLATCYFQSNEKEKAILHVEKIAQLKPDDFSIHYTLGNIYASEGNEKEAISEYERANSSVIDGVDKSFVSDMLHRLANSYTKSGDIDNAAKIYEKILDLELTNEPVTIHYNLGLIYVDAKKIKEAIKEFVKAKQYSPHAEPISFYLALCYEELEDYDNAIIELKSFIDYDPDAWLMRINLSNIYEKIKQYENAELEREKAFVILEESVSKGSKGLREYITLSQLFQRNGKDKKAVETLKTAISNVINEDDDAISEVRFMLANIYYEMNNHNNVVVELEKVLQIDPDNHQANNFLGYFFIEQGEQLDRAIDLIKKALSVNPENAAYLDSLGWAYYKLAKEDDGKIIFALQKLIEASNFAEDPEIMGHMGDVYYSLGYWEKAQSQWENALDLWKKLEAEVPPHFKYETARELKAKKTIRNRLDKIKCLKVVESSEKMLESEKKLCVNDER